MARDEHIRASSEEMLLDLEGFGGTSLTPPPLMPMAAPTPDKGHSPLAKWSSSTSPVHDSSRPASAPGKKTTLSSSSSLMEFGGESRVSAHGEPMGVGVFDPVRGEPMHAGGFDPVGSHSRTDHVDDDDDEELELRFASGDFRSTNV
jgi:hypothetical protein